MSQLDEVGECSNKFKRKQGSSDEDDEDKEVEQLTNRNKRIYLESNSEKNEPKADKKQILFDAVKKIEKIQSTLRKLNNSQEDDDQFSSSENEDYSSSSDQENEVPSDHENADDLFQDNLMMSAEALGFAMCARETFKFLRSYGIEPNDPIYISLKDRLVGTRK